MDPGTGPKALIFAVTTGSFILAGFYAQQRIIKSMGKENLIAATTITRTVEYIREQEMQNIGNGLKGSESMERIWSIKIAEPPPELSS